MFIESSEKARNELLSELFDNEVPDGAALKLDKFVQTTFEKIKRQVIYTFVGVFVASIALLWIGLWFLVDKDTSLLVGEYILPTDRIVTEKVLLSLIGATVVQLGVSMGILLKFLFPEQKSIEP